MSVAAMFSIQSNTGCLDSYCSGVVKNCINTLGSLNTKLPQGKKKKKKNSQITVTFPHRTKFEENLAAFLLIVNTGLVSCLYEK